MNRKTVIHNTRLGDLASDPLADVFRAGVHELLATAAGAEVSEFIPSYTSLLDDEWRHTDYFQKFLFTPASGLRYWL